MSHLSVAFKGKTTTEIKEAAARVVTLMREGKADYKKMSIRDIAEATLGSAGMDALKAANDEGFVGSVLREAVEPVMNAAFRNITGELIYKGVYEAYKSPDYIGGQLVTEETDNEDNVRIPGLSPIDDDAIVVKEGEEFSNTKFGEDYIDLPKSEKRGLKIGITREMLFFDRTGRVLEMARSVGERVGTSKEKRTLQVVLGITNTFIRNGTARNTYVVAGGTEKRPNLLASTPLTDWKDIDVAMALFNDMVDDRTVGEPILGNPDTIIVPTNKLLTAKQILTATTVMYSDNPALGTVKNDRAAANPVAGMFKIVSSPWIKRLLVTWGGTGAGTGANADDNWLIGQPKRAFRYRTLFPMQVRAAAAGDQDEFDRDVVAKFRADERGVPYVYAPWYMAKLYNA